MTSALITGAHGFIARHLARALHRRGIQVSGIGHGAWHETERAAWGVDHWLDGEVTRANLDVVGAHSGTPDTIYHLAGGSSVGFSLLAPVEDFRRSVLSTAELLDWARVSAPKARLLFTSSGAVYGAGYNRNIREIDALAPHSPYGYHKRLTELLFESYGRNFGLNVATVRLFSVYGPGLRKQLLWDVCHRLQADPDRLVLGGSGQEARDWLHVTDAVHLLHAAIAQATPQGFVVNGGTGVAATVREVAGYLCKSWGARTDIAFSGATRAGDPEYLVADVSRMSTLTFAPKVTPEVGIREYVDWFRRAGSKALE